MRVVEVGDVEGVPGPAERFDKPVWAETLIEATDAMPLVLARVSFTPGARTAWHTHPRGQLIVATAGVGRVQLDDAPVVELRPGDAVAVEPGERHWHGASRCIARGATRRTHDRHHLSWRIVRTIPRTGASTAAASLSVAMLTRAVTNS